MGRITKNKKKFKDQIKATKYIVLLILLKPLRTKSFPQCLVLGTYYCTHPEDICTSLYMKFGLYSKKDITVNCVTIYESQPHS